MPELDFVKCSPSDWILLLGELHDAIATEDKAETEAEVTENGGVTGDC